MQNIPLNRERLAGGMFLLAALLYIHTAGPSLVPYRDAGEMATTVPMLGIIHPTSYPVYSMAGRLFSELPLGNPAYRLNILSALFTAAAWAILFLFLAESFNTPAAFVAVLMGATSYHFWTHALVSEMYSLNLFFLISILWAVHRQRLPLAAFLFGLGLANRPDLLLTLPALLILLPFHSPFLKGEMAQIVFFFILGLSAYLYLPLRALQHPWMNWNDPSTLDRLIRTLLRRGYGSTLDLLSTSYRTGENFFSELILYGRHLCMDFLWIGPLLGGLGVFALYRTDRRLCLSFITGIVFSGILFIFLGNLPPNPHAVAIVEAGYLNPDIFYLILIAAGLYAILVHWPRLATPLVILLTCVTVSFSIPLYPQVSRRDNFLAVDFARNVYHSVPESSLIVAKSDVPIFSLFYGHWMDPRMKDRWPLGQGLVASAWYLRMMQQQVPGLELTGLQTAADWTILSNLNPDKYLFATGDIDWPEKPSDFFRAQGLVNLWNSSRPASPAHAPMSDDLLIRRGIYRYGAYRDFFSNELVEEYSRAALAQAQTFAARQDWPNARRAYLHALAIKPGEPYAAYGLAYTAFQTQDLPAAARYYAWTIESFDRLLASAEAWKSFSTIKNSLRTDKAQALAQWGVTEERLGHTARAKSLYESALEVDPECQDAHYNLAVLYWGQSRWPQVVEHLQAMAKAHPEDPRWKRYLPAALAKMR